MKNLHDLHRDWPTIVGQSGVRDDVANYLPRQPRILGNSYKTAKGDGLRIETGVIYMSPGVESGVEMCPHRTDGCYRACLGHSSGMMVTTPARRARLWKTALYLGDIVEWRDRLDTEVRSLVRRAYGQGYTPAVRIDGTSDTGEAERGAWIRRYPNVAWYDYTKDVERAIRVARQYSQDEYHVTYSHHGDYTATHRALYRGVPVAVVFSTKRGEALPEHWQNYRVIDGDLTDARFLDRGLFDIPADQGYVVGLRFKTARNRAKMLAAAVRAGFVVEA